MRQLFLCMLTLFLCVANIHAEDTDISPYDNAIYVTTPCTVMQGGEMELSINMKNTKKPMTGLSFYLELPEGMAFCIDESGQLEIALNSNRAPKGCALTYTLINQRLVKVMAYSNTLQAFTGSDGEVISIKAMAGVSMKVGTYNASITSAQLTDNRLYNAPDVAFSINVTAGPGDANRDQIINVGDLVAIRSYINGSPTPGFDTKGADIDKNNKIDNNDCVRIRQLILISNNVP